MSSSLFNINCTNKAIDVCHDLRNKGHRLIHSTESVAIFQKEDVLTRVDLDGTLTIGKHTKV